MGTQTSLVGREDEQARLEELLARAGAGHGSLLLLCGEAGVGKSSLAAALADSADHVIQGVAAGGLTAPYGPIVDALRSRLRADPAALDGCGPLRSHLALLLPELGEPAGDSDRATIFEAIRCALAHLAEPGPLLVVLDDLQWSDEATIELLAALASPLREIPVLVLAAYRSDGLPREHRLRWLRNELRRGGVLEELALKPLDPAETARLLRELLGADPSPALVRTVQDRTVGSPFFVEELVAALRLRGALREGRRGLELAGREDVPVPDTVREAVMVRMSELSPAGRAAAEAAAVAGPQVDLALAAGTVPEEGIAELTEIGLLEETAPGRAAFRHALTCEAIYTDVPWMRRRTLHAGFAAAIEGRGGPSLELAAHWLGAGETTRAREALVLAARESERLQAHRDAARAAREALELWGEGEAEELRLETLERCGRCAEISGELGDASKAWRELASSCDRAGDLAGYARAQRYLAAVHELLGERDAAFAARRLAADAFASGGEPGEAALERLAMADHHRRGARYAEAIELARLAGEEAGAAGRPDLGARALGVRGVAEAKGGEFEAGLNSVRAGLALALEHELTPTAAELYQRLSLVLYDGADYRLAEEALDTALGLCRIDGDEGTEVACVTCLVYVLRERGEWSRASEMGRELIDAGTAVWVAEGLLGAILAFQGRLSSARRLLTASRSVSGAVGHYNMFVDSTTALAQVAAAEGLDDEASKYCGELLDRWRQSEDHHYAVWGMRWAATFLAGRGDRQGANACAEALGQMAADAGHPDALAALAQAIGEIALLDGDAPEAAEHLERAVALHRDLAIPFERAQIELRAGVALGAAGSREEALERLSGAYRTARKLGAQPLAAAAAREVAELGESVAQRLGSRAEQAADGVRLTRREHEVLRHVAVGRTNREIAQELFISPRTVDMHVRNLLGKLECRSRVEASHRAGGGGGGGGGGAGGGGVVGGARGAELTQDQQRAEDAGVVGVPPAGFGLGQTGHLRVDQLDLLRGVGHHVVDRVVELAFAAARFQVVGRFQAAGVRRRLAALAEAGSGQHPVGLAVARLHFRLHVGVEVAEQDHRQLAVGGAARGDQLGRLLGADARHFGLVVKRLEVRVDEVEFLAAADLGVDRGPAAGHRDFGAAGNFDDQRVGEVAAGRLRGDDAGADPGEDHVAHRQAAVDLGVGEQASAAAGTVAGHAVGVGGGLEVELVLDDDRPVLGAFLVQLREQQRQEVVLDGFRRRFAGQDRARRGRRFTPQRDLL
jgi:DNA-binding NarL/FixJ family response regulator